MVTRLDVIALAFMLAGVYVWTIYGIQFLPIVPMFFAGILDPEAFSLITMPQSIGFVLCWCAMVFVIGYALIFRAAALVAWAIPEPKADETVTPWSVHDVQPVAISILGVAFVAKGLPNVASNVIQWLFFSQRDMPEQYVDIFGGHVVTHVVQIALGLIMFVYARRILWERWQQTGDEKSES